LSQNVIVLNQNNSGNKSSRQLVLAGKNCSKIVNANIQDNNEKQLKLNIAIEPCPPNRRGKKRTKSKRREFTLSCRVIGDADLAAGGKQNSLAAAGGEQSSGKRTHSDVEMSDDDENSPEDKRSTKLPGATKTKGILMSSSISQLPSGKNVTFETTVNNWEKVNH